MITVKIDDADYTVLLDDDGGIICPDGIRERIKQRVQVDRIISNLPVVGVHTYFTGWINNVYCAGKTVKELINDYYCSPWRV